MFGPMLNAKGKNVLDTTAFFYCLKTLIPCLQSRDQASMLVNDFFFFAEFFAEFVQKHNYVSSGGRDFCSCPPAWPP